MPTSVFHSGLALLVLVALPLAPGLEQQSIREDEVEKWIAEQYQCSNPDQVHIIKLEAVDFAHDGGPQAIVIAMSCAAGTAGPDVQLVLSRGSDGKLIELGPPPVDEKTIAAAPLFGPGNANLGVENGLLLLKYTDATGRNNPFVIKYRWNGKQFEQAGIEASKPFPTSYDCGQADEDVERAICYVKSLADLDLEMDSAYKEVRSNLPASKKTSLRDRQRKWLGARDAECPISDKWFVDCLESHYRQRIGELREMKLSAKTPQ